MSESDSFIHEVSEEVRRERFAAFLRRYGWIIASLLVLVIGGAAFNEWRKARSQAAAEAAGDALRAALQETDPAGRAEQLGAIAATGGAGAALALLAEAGSLLDAGDPTAAAAVLAALADGAEAPQLYRSMAALQRVMILGPEMDPAERQATLQTLASDGAPFRLLAIEQRALMNLESGDEAAAADDFETILVDPGATPQLAARARQLIEAIGAEPPDGLTPVAPVDG